MRRPKLSLALLSSAMAVPACGGSGPDGPVAPPPPPVTATVSGVVIETGRVVERPIAGATVRIGSVSAVTGPDGGFVLEAVPTGSATLEASAEGFDPVTQIFPLQPGANSRDIPMVRSLAIHELGDFTVGLPPEVSAFRGVVHFAPGSGGQSHPFATGEDVSGLEFEFRSAFLVLAEVHGLALMGSADLDDGSATHGAILGALDDVAAASGHPELAQAPLLVLGFSKGASLAYSFSRAHSGRVAGFAPIKGINLTNPGPAGSIPAYFILGELDQVVEPNGPISIFEEGRAAGAPWALAIEPGVGHVPPLLDFHLLVNWSDAVLARRLPALPPLDEASGWLGNRESFVIASYDCFSGEKAAASWFPSEETARDWQTNVSSGSVNTVETC